MNRRSITVCALLAFVVLLTASVTLDASPTPDPKKNKKKNDVDALLAQSLLRQGYGFMQQQLYEEAIQKFHEAEAANPGNATVDNMTGLCYMSLERYDEALMSFNLALLKIPGFTDARNNRGTAYLMLEQYRLAEVDFIAALSDSTYPHRWKVYYNLGVTYFNRGQVGAAEENFTKAITAPTPVFEAFLRLAEIAQDQGRTDAALLLLEEARFKHPERLEGTLAYGRLLVFLERYDEARPYLEDVVASDPGSAMAVEARELLVRP